MIETDNTSRLVREILLGALENENYNLGTSGENLRNDSHFTEEIGINSIDLLEFFLRIEDQFEIQIHDDDARSLTSVYAVIHFLKAKQSHPLHFKNTAQSQPKAPPFFKDMPLTPVALYSKTQKAYYLRASNPPSVTQLQAAIGVDGPLLKVSRMRVKPQRPVGNWLLDALQEPNFERLAHHLNPVSFSLGEVIYESGGRLHNVYFPTTSHVSLLYTMINGSTAEMGLIGNEGVVGVALYMGGETTPNRAVIQGSGNALELNVTAMLEEFALGGEFQQLLLRYTMALISQISQTAVCNRLHSVEKRLCRWLLMTHDRVNSDELQMTQEFISNMLGVRREGVTHAAKSLQQRGLIRYGRGTIRIVDRAGLEKCVCECFEVVREEYSRLRSMDNALSIKAN